MFERGRIGWPAMVGLLLLIPAYFGVTGGIRAFVNHKIESNRGQPLPEFSLADRDGNTVSRESLLGRPAVIHFFRSRCVNCEAERPELKAFVAGLDPAEVSVVSVMTDPVEGYDQETTAATLKRHDYSWPILMATEEFVDAFHGVGWSRVTPITYFVSKDGQIVTSRRSQQTREELHAALKEAIAG